MVKLFNGSQEEQLKEIVAQLKQARQEKSIRIEEVSAHTRIRPAFLQALEEGRFEDLPEPIYVQGFIRHYGDALGLDGAALAKNFATAFSPSKSEEHQESLEEKPNIYIPLVVPYALLLAGAIFGLFYILNPQRGLDSHSQTKASSSTSQSKTVSSPVVSTPPKAISGKKIQSTPVASIPAASTTNSRLTSTPAPTSLSSPNPTISPVAQTPSPVEVTLELQDQSWLRVKADGKTVFMGILNKGERKTWTANKDLTIRSGNAGAVLVSENNQPPKPLGNMGSVKQVTFTGHEQ